MSQKSWPVWTTTGLAIAGLLLFQAAVLGWMGRELICTCGYVKLWHGNPMSSENSQHIADWYSLSHVLHGLLFYWGLRYLAPGWSIPKRLMVALSIEVGWEILENTDFIIDRYREATVSLDYHGDSIVNSLSDTLFALLGFMVAARLPARASVGLAVAFELVALVAIRDNLTLNVLMLIAPIEAVRAWQAAL